MTFAAGRVLLNLPQRARDVAGCDAEGGQLRGIDLDADLTLDAADPLEPADARHAQHGFGHRIFGEPGERLLVHTSRGGNAHIPAAASKANRMVVGIGLRIDQVARFMAIAPTGR
jgi:hypothetical protein